MTKIAHDSGKRPATQKAPRVKRAPHTDRYAGRDELADLLATLAAHFNGVRS